MMMLPEYVAEQRFMDAWIILHSARVMMDTPCQNNPFVFEMFLYGNAALTERIAVQQEALLQNLGVDRETIYAMSPDEIEAFTQAYLVDPAQNAALEAYLDAYPELQAHAQSRIPDRVRQAVMLLDREDAGCLYLDPDEIAPYLSILLERLQPLEAQRQEISEEDEASQSAYIEAVDRIVLEVARGMVPEIFTPERIARLRTAFQNYQRHFVRAGDNRTAVLARTADKMLRDVERRWGPALAVYVLCLTARNAAEDVGRGMGTERTGLERRGGRSAMIIYTNRKGVTYTLCQSVTKTGKPRYSFAREPQGEPVEAIPEGYEIRESVNGVVSLAKVRPGHILAEEVAVVAAAIQQHPRSRNYRLDVKPDRIDIYELVSGGMDDVLAIFDDVLP